DLGERGDRVGHVVGVPGRQVGRLGGGRGGDGDGEGGNERETVDRHDGLRARVPRLYPPGSRPAHLPPPGGLSPLSDSFSLSRSISASIRAALANSDADAFSAPAST